MDKNHVVDGIPSIKLTLKRENESGTINLSSFYGSYNYDTDLEIVPDTEYEFYCPHCETKITSDRECDECSGKMIPLDIEDGGIVRFCSRSGCKNHNVEFENLEKIHDYFDYHINEEAIVHVHTEREKKTEKELIKSGTFLRIYCPHCEQSLIEKNSVFFRIINDNGEQGFLMLSPYLNVFEHKSTVYIPDGATAKEILCPYCKSNLISDEVKCENCGAPAVNVDVAAVRRLIDFYFCSKKGCHWHNLGKDDLNHVMLEDSDAW
ncbi:MAG: class I tRNA ligase family protein [Candidatus Heimdallarchaeota archaeon]|nr:class I tRNA ligase family protein [Candidatus Heimdallarchaeota archaeon]